MEFSIFRDTLQHTLGSVTYGFESRNATRLIEEPLLYSPAELGLVTGLLTTATACILNPQVTMLKEDFFHLEQIRFKAMFHFILSLASFCIISPIVFPSLVLLYAYRFVISLILKIQLRDKFVSMFEGTDTVWAIEDVTCKSVINVLASLNVTPSANNSNLLVNLRELAKQRLLDEDNQLEKLSCLRKKAYGYFYWSRCEQFDITDHVRWLDETDEVDIHDEKSLNGMLSRLVTRPLPREDQASWEILVSRNHLSQKSDCFKDMEEGLIFSGRAHDDPRNTVRVPIIFRAHHALGDGFTLFKILLAMIADSKNVDVTLKDQRKEIIPVEPSVQVAKADDLRKLNLASLNAEFLLRNNKNILGASMPFSLLINASLKKSLERYAVMKFGKLASFREISEAFIETTFTKIKESTERMATIALSILYQVARVTLAVIGMPCFLLQQSFRGMDNSALHGPKLSGEKIIASWIESDSSKTIVDRDMLTKIRRIKNATATRFGDVILAALSASLHNYFKQIGEFSPKVLTVVLPTRMAPLDDSSRLDNGFSVGLLPLCISGSTEVQAMKCTKSNNDLTIMERLFDVARSSQKLRNETDYLINFWVMKWLSAALPEILLRPMLQSHSTLVFSNIPGPREIRILGQKLGNIVFWVPHRATTGVTLSLLTYGGNMQLGLMADKAVIQNVQLLSDILENTVQEIDNLHETIFMSQFTRSLHNLKTASTNSVSESCKQN